MRVRIARDELRRLRELTQTINALHSELADLVVAIRGRAAGDQRGHQEA